MQLLRKTAATALLAALTLSASAASQVATAVLREGEPIPGMPTKTFQEIDGLEVSADGGYVVALRTSGFHGPTDLLWGSLTGDVVDVLRTPSNIGGLEQVSFGSTMGISNGALLYSAELDSLPGTYRTNLWTDGSPLLTDGDPGPFPGTTWTGFGSVGTLRNGTPWFQGSITPGLNNASVASGMFVGLPSTLLGLTGIVLTTTNLLVTSIDVGPESISSAGSHHIFTCESSDGVSLTDAWVVIDGLPLSIDALVITGW